MTIFRSFCPTKNQPSFVLLPQDCVSGYYKYLITVTTLSSTQSQDTLKAEHQGFASSTLLDLTTHQNSEFSICHKLLILKSADPVFSHSIWLVLAPFSTKDPNSPSHCFNLTIPLVCVNHCTMFKYLFTLLKLIPVFLSPLSPLESLKRQMFSPNRV